MDATRSPQPNLVGDAMRLGKVVRRAFIAEMAEEAWAHEAGMRPGCYAVLRALGTGPMSQRELADTVQLDPSMIVDLIDRLEQAGFVERRRDPHDRRRYVLHVTAAGRRARGRFDAASERANAALLAGLSDAERAELSRLLALVLDPDA